MADPVSDLQRALMNFEGNMQAAVSLANDWASKNNSKIFIALLTMMDYPKRYLDYVDSMKARAAMTGKLDPATLKNLKVLKNIVSNLSTYNLANDLKATYGKEQFYPRLAFLGESIKGIFIPVAQALAAVNPDDPNNVMQHAPNLSRILSSSSDRFVNAVQDTIEDANKIQTVAEEINKLREGFRK